MYLKANDIKVEVDYSVLTHSISVDDVIEYIEELRELKSYEIDPCYYDAIVRICDVEYNVEFYYNETTEKYTIKIKALDY